MGFRAFCRALRDLSGLPEMVVRPRDFLGAHSERAVWALEPWSAELADAWELFLDIGGFPRAVGEFVAGGAVGEGFAQGLWDVLAGETLHTARMSEAEVAVLHRLVENLCSPVNASKIARDVGLSGHQAATDRIEDLVVAFLAWRCHRIRAGLPNPAAQRKLYFVDPLIAGLAHRRNAAYAAPDRSQLHEQQIGLALARALSAGDGAVGGAVGGGAAAAFVQADRVMYERSKTNAEIDFVGPELDVAFECKYSDSGWRSAARTLRAHHERGVIVTRSQLVLGEGEPVWALPAGLAAWLLGV
jgi:predicted AAA+ superfamily ATPase